MPYARTVNIPEGADPGPAQGVGDSVDQLGGRLRAARVKAGITARQMARDLGMSPSFISQMERGRSQPSVATLYSISRLLGVSVDELFHAGIAVAADHTAESVATSSGGERSGPSRGGRADDLSYRAGSAESNHPAPGGKHLAHRDRPRLVMATGVVWEQLAAISDHNLDFMEITYPPGSSSTNDGRMLRHHGTEYGYLLTGELEVALESETFTLHAGESVSLDSTRPHRFTNTGRVDALGVWVVHYCTTPLDNA
jgi:transcriptional regulator with XRE-family HTH domain/quercetin dioxygenase-like cupin family protein